MFCNQCGFENPDQAEFCSDCGNSMNPQPQTPQIHKPRKKLPLILGICAAVILLIVGLGLVFRLQIIKAISPQNYLQMAMAQTFTANPNDLISQLNLTQFDKKTTTQSFSFDGQGVSVEGELQLDVVKEIAMLNLSASANGTSYDDNQLFISPDLIAASLPDSGLDETILTVDPATLNASWTDKGWDAIYALPNVQDIIRQCFGQGNTEVISQKFMQDYQILIDTLSKEIEFASGESEKAAIDGQTYQLDVMSYTIPKKSFNNFMEDYFALCLNVYRDQYTAMYGEDIPDEIEQFLTNFETVSESYQVDDDITINFSIDQAGLIRKILIDGISLDLVQSADYAMDIEIKVELGGKTSPTDVIEAEITAESSYDTYVFQLKREIETKNGVLTDAINVELSSNNVTDDLSLELTCEWDKNDQKGNNLEVSFLCESASSTLADVTLTGQLTCQPGLISLQDATIESADAGDLFDFNYSLQELKSPIGFDTSSATPLLETDEFVEYMDGQLVSLNQSKAYSLLNSVLYALADGADLSSVPAGTSIDDLESAIAGYLWYPIRSDDTFGITITEGQVESVNYNGQSQINSEFQAQETENQAIDIFNASELYFAADIMLSVDNIYNIQYSPEDLEWYTEVTEWPVIVSRAYRGDGSGWKVGISAEGVVQVSVNGFHYNNTTELLE